MAEDTISLAVKEDANSGSGLSSLKILSYNVWLREDVEMHRRMKAIGDLIQLHSPDLICFQVIGHYFSVAFVNSVKCCIARHRIYKR